MHMAVYTRTGDKGNTGFIGGRMSKGDLLTEAIGAVDELNSNLGVLAASTALHSSIKSRMFEVQNMLFSIGSTLADRRGTLFQDTRFQNFILGVEETKWKH
jgi:cob(I)alamin adenosyltransferase